MHEMSKVGQAKTAQTEAFPKNHNNTSPRAMPHLHTEQHVRVDIVQRVKDGQVQLGLAQDAAGLVVLPADILPVQLCEWVQQQPEPRHRICRQLCQQKFPAGDQRRLVFLQAKGGNSSAEHKA